LESPAPPSPDDTPAAPPAAQRRAADGAFDHGLDAALGAAAALSARLTTLASLPDRAAQRLALLRLPAMLQSVGQAVARVEAAGAARSSGDDGGDALTGLADRARLQAAGAALVLRYPDAPLMLIAADVDHLRHVNDTCSRSTGDAVLRAVADVLRAQSRPQDVIARLDGGLFVVALGGPVSTTRALLVAERLRAAIEAHAWATLGAALHVTASIGVAARAPGESLDDALARAGAALQDCKRGGRNQVRSRA
jgi:two-component system, cell cycle response regulator